jgi:hypothetical protein
MERHLLLSWMGVIKRMGQLRATVVRLVRVGTARLLQIGRGSPARNSRTGQELDDSKGAENPAGNQSLPTRSTLVRNSALLRPSLKGVHVRISGGCGRIGRCRHRCQI